MSEMGPMAEQSRAELLQEIQALREQLRQQDQQLTRFKRLSGTGRRTYTVAEKTQRTPARRQFTPELLEWLIVAVLSRVPGRSGLFEIDGQGSIRAAGGSLCQAFAGPRQNLKGTSWQSLLAASDVPVWQNYFANLDETHIDENLSLHIKTASDSLLVDVWAHRRRPASAFSGTDAESGVWLFVSERPAGAVAGSNPIAKRWAGVFAHELNQPLAAALLSAQGCRSLLTLRNARPAELTEHLDGLVHRVQLAADIVRRLRMMAGGEPPRRVSVDIREVVRRAFDVLQSDLDAHHVSVTLDFVRDCPNVKIDPVQIVQVMVNLVRNALEAMNRVPVPQRQLTVHTQFNVREAIVAVEDRGVGMSPEMIRHLFEPLASTKPTGMGLGLALCRQILETHGGRIWVTPNSPSGCIFSFSIPLISEEP